MSSARFADRTVYITGAAAGLGRAAALLFAHEGAKVFAVDCNGDGVVETVNAIRAAGGAALGGVCDVTDCDSVQASVEYMVEQFGSLQVLVNVAGVGKAARFEEIDEREWGRTLAVNLTGVFHTIKAALPHLLQHRGANIVNVASIAGLRGQAYASAYCASKAGLINFTRSLALEFATRNLRANCIAPAGVRTDLIQQFIPREEIAFLASDDARMINGAVLVCDGGTLA
jgi:meso-butanediol dehydrogenase/(S,S)-butanediol dehydrogenase/diacetyl reductase